MKSKIDRELLAVKLGLKQADDSDKDLGPVDVNAYRIKYDRDIEMFFKQFTPKTQSGVLGAFAALGATGIALAAAGLASPVVAVGGGAALLLTSAGVAAGKVISNTYAYSKVKFVKCGVGGTEASANAMKNIKQYSHMLQTSKDKKFVIDGVKYSRKQLKAHIKELEGKVGFVDIVKEAAEISNQAAIALANNPNTKKIDFNGVTYSRNKLERLVEQNETIAYHGLRHLLKKGLEISDQISGLESHPLTKSQQQQLRELKRMIIAIGDCANELASERTRPPLRFERGLDSQDKYNPYKKLIIDAIGRGCLLGDDKQNAQIKQIAKQRKGKKIDEELAAMQYSNMYEREALEKFDAEKTAMLNANRTIRAENDIFEKILIELQEKDGDMSQVTAGDEASRRKVAIMLADQVVTNWATLVVNNLPKELKDRHKEEFENALSNIAEARLSGDEEKYDASVQALEILANNVYGRISALAYGKGMKNAYDQYKEEVARLRKGYERSVQSAWNKRAKTQKLNKENKELAQNLAEIEEDNERLKQENEQQAGEIEEASGYVMRTTHELMMANQTIEQQGAQIGKLTKGYTRAIKRGVNDRTTKRTQKAQIAGLEQTLEEANVENQTLTQQAEEKTAKLTQAGEELKKARKKGRKLQTERDELREENETLGTLLAVMAGKHKKSREELQSERNKGRRLQAERDHLDAWAAAGLTRVEEQAAELDKTKTALQTANSENAQLKQAADSAAAETKAVKDKLAKERKINTSRQKEIKAQAAKIDQQAEIIEGQAQTIDAQTAQIGQLTEEANQYVSANAKNIQQIVDLTAENERLSAENIYSTDVAGNLAYDLHKTRKEIEELLAARQSDAQYISDLEGQNATLSAQNEQYAEDIAAAEAKTGGQIYNRDLGAARRRLNHVLDTVEAHVEYTKQHIKNYDRETVNLLTYYTKGIRERDPAKQSITDVNYDKELLAAVYNANKLSLAPLSKQQLRDIVDEHKEEKGVKK